MSENTLNDSSLYNFYQTNNLALARSIIIKNSLTADAMNKALYTHPKSRYDNILYADENHPETWRYYCHLAGEYHPADDMMEVISLDTLQKIEFTKEKMKIHRATWRNYALGTEYFNELVKKYPEQEMLIRGIINPIDKQMAINAKEYDILYYDSSLVDHNEYFLISELQEKIKRYLQRWDVAAYNLIDEYYEPMRMMMLYMFIPSFLMNIRLKYAHTPYANKYHIWNYLGSTLELDRYRAYLTTEQTMWLYKNLRYIKANAGKQLTFEEITEYVMSKRNLPISRFKIHRDVSDILNNNPELEIERQQINLPNLDYRSKDDTLSLKSLMEKEIPTALDNKDHLDIYHDDGREMWRYGQHDNLRTKVIESHVEDYSAQEVFEIDNTLFDYWVYMSATDRYDTIINVNNPASAEAITLNTKEALIVFIYCLWRGLQPKEKDDTGEIGYITAKDIYFPIMPNVDKLRSHFWEKEHSELYIRFLQDQYPDMGVAYSTEEFHKFCERIHRFKYTTYDLWGLIHDVSHQGEVHLLTDSLKADYVFPLLPEGTDTYFNYCKERGWLIMNLTQEQYLELSNDIFVKITGKDLTKGNTIESIQENMVRLMEKLSSYNIHFVKTINSQNVAVLNLPAPRFGLIESRSAARYWWLKDKPVLSRLRIREATYAPLSFNLFSDENTVYDAHESHRKFIELPIEFNDYHRDSSRTHLRYETSVFDNFYITDDTDVVERSYWIRNGSLFSGEFVAYELLDTIDLGLFRDEVWIEIEGALAVSNTPSPYDWESFRQRYGDRVEPNIFNVDGTLGYRSPEEERNIKPFDQSYSLEGFEWNLAEVEQQQYPLATHYLLDGFKFDNSSFTLSEEYVHLRDIADEQLEGFEWTGHVVQVDLSAHRLDYIANPMLDGFEWGETP